MLRRAAYRAKANGHSVGDVRTRPPGGRKSIETFRSLEATIARAQVLLSRVDVQQFRIYATTGFGHRLVGTVSRDRGYQPVGNQA